MASILQKCHEGKDRNRMILSGDERASWVAQKTRKAQTALNEALGNIAMQYWDTAANRLYYALFHIAEALLIKTGLSVYTHAGVIHLLAEHFVRSGKLSREDGRLYAKVFNLSQTSDYGEWDVLAREDVEACVEPVQTLVAKIIALLDG